MLGVDPAGGAAPPGAADADGLLPPCPLWCFLPLCWPVPGLSLGAGAGVLGTAGSWITFRFVVDAVAAYPHRDGASQEIWSMPALPCQPEHPAGQDDLEHDADDQQRHGLLRRVHRGRDEQAKRHRRDRQQRPSRAAIPPAGSGRGTTRSAGSSRPARPISTSSDRLERADHAEDDQLGEQVRAGRQAGRAFPAVDRSFLDQFPDGVGGAGEARADDQDQQQR